MAVPPAPGAVTTRTDETSVTTDSQPHHGALRLILLFTLLVLMVASLALLVYGSVTRPVEAVGISAEDDTQADRDAVMAQTRQFVLRLNTYGPDQLDDQGHLGAYRDQVLEVITPKFATDFEKSGLPIAEQTVAQAGYGRSANVFGVGVESMDADSATAILAAGLTGSYPDPKNPDDETKRVDADQDVLRWEVDLVRSDGEWLIDDYAPVTGEGAE